MDYATLLRRTSFALTMALIAVLICYFWIDRPVAFFVHRHHIDEINFLRWLTYPPPELQTWSPLLVTLLLVRGAWRPLLPWEKVLLVACLSLIVADHSVSVSAMFVAATGRRPGGRTIHRLLTPEPTGFIPFSVATILAVSPRAMRRGFSALAWFG